MRLNSWRAGPVFFVAVVMFASTADAGALLMVDGQSYSGVIEKIDDAEIQFLWQRQKDQPADINVGDEEMLFQAQGHASEVRIIPRAEVLSMDGVPLDRFEALFGYNLFYRTIQEMEAGRIRTASTGNFVTQVKAAVVLFFVLVVIVPLLLVLVTILMPGERLSYFGAFGFAVVFTVVGLGAALASALMTSQIELLGGPSAQVALSIVIAAIMAGVTHLGTRHSFIQGILFTVVWGMSLVLAGQVTARILGVGSV